MLSYKLKHNSAVHTTSASASTNVYVDVSAVAKDRANSFAKAKKAKADSAEKEIGHKNQGTGKLKGERKTKHQKRRPGDKGEKKRQKPEWTSHK